MASGATSFGVAPFPEAATRAARIRYQHSPHRWINHGTNELTKIKLRFTGRDHTGDGDDNVGVGRRSTTAHLMGRSCGIQSWRKPIGRVELWPDTGAAVRRSVQAAARTLQRRWPQCSGPRLIGIVELAGGDAEPNEHYDYRVRGRITTHLCAARALDASGQKRRMRGDPFHRTVQRSISGGRALLCDGRLRLWHQYQGVCAGKRHA